MEALQTDFASTVERIAGCAVTPDALALLRLATHLGTVTARAQGVTPTASAHWASVMQAAVHHDSPASRWLSALPWNFLRSRTAGLGDPITIALRRALPSARRRTLAGEAAATGRDGWFTDSAQAQIAAAGRLVGHTMRLADFSRRRTPEPGQLTVTHLVASAVLDTVSGHDADLARALSLGTANDESFRKVRAHVATWCADLTSLFSDEGRRLLEVHWQDKPGMLFYERKLDPDLAPFLEVRGDRLPFEGITAGAFPDARAFHAAIGPLPRLLLALREGSPKPPARWTPLIRWLDGFDAIEGSSYFDAMPLDVGPRGGQGYTLLYRAEQVAPVIDLQHLLLAAVAETSALPPWAEVGPLPYPRAGNTPAAWQERRDALLHIARRHPDLRTPRLQRTADWARLLLPQELVSVPVATDERPVGDLLGFRRYADAFASVIAQRDVRPPLAIGLFGAWGSGKSAMIGMIGDALADIDRRAEHDERPDGEDPRFCRGIVRIVFNAWHYAETNLWASLFVRVLEELSRHFREAPPETAAAEREGALRDLEAAREEAGAAAAALAAAQTQAVSAVAEAARAAEALAAAREQARAAEAARVREEAARGVVEEMRRDLRDLTGDAAVLLGALGQPAPRMLAGKSGEEVAARLTELKGELETAVGQAAAVRGPAGRLASLLRWTVAGRRLWMLLSLLLLVGFAAFVVWHAGGFEWLAGRILTGLASLALLGAPLRSWYREGQDALKKAPAIIGRLAGAAETVRARVEERERAAQEAREAGATTREAEATREARRQAEESAEAAREADARAEAARREAQAARARVAQLQERVETLAPERLLARFLADRAASEDYARHLGLPTRIRRDLEELQAHFFDLRDAATAARRADRIVLFIDDLDRCKPDVVVKVLEAVHVLLASELFVVIVGVDVRWLRRSLELHHRGQFGEDGPLDAADFLEKIFQVPFWVPPMAPAGRAAILDAALPSPGGPGRAGGAAARSGADRPAPAARIEPDPSNIDEGMAAKPAADPTADSTAHSGPLPLPQLDRVLLNDGREREVVRRWGALAGETPRRLKRFARSYLILTASLPRDERRAFDDAGACEVVARLLAFGCAAPDLWPVLARESEGDGPLGTPDLPPADTRRWLRFFGPDTDPPDREAVRPWLELVARFGFADPGSVAR